MCVNCCTTKEDDEAFVSCEMILHISIIFLNAGDVTRL